MAIKIEYKVDIVKNNSGYDTFIVGVDDFKPRLFSDIGEAYIFIEEQSFGSYYITPIYYKI